MAEREIPIDETGPHFTQTTELEGVTYEFEFRWNEREQRWYMDLRDLEGNDILVGTKMVANWSLLRARVKDEERPPGELVLQDTSGGGLDPRLGDLGTRVRLIYVPEADVPA